jgi:hypothetical protein
MAARASQRSARHSFGIERVAVECETAGQESLLLLGAEQLITQEFDVLRNPENLLRLKSLPAMWAGYLREQLDRRRGRKARAD